MCVCALSAATYRDWGAWREGCGGRGRLGTEAGLDWGAQRDRTLGSPCHPTTRDQGWQKGWAKLAAASPSWDGGVRGPFRPGEEVMKENHQNAGTVTQPCRHGARVPWHSLGYTGDEHTQPHFSRHTHVPGKARCAHAEPPRHIHAISAGTWGSPSGTRMCTHSCSNPLHTRARNPDAHARAYTHYAGVFHRSSCRHRCTRCHHRGRCSRATCGIRPAHGGICAGSHTHSRHTLVPSPHTDGGSSDPQG